VRSKLTMPSMPFYVTICSKFCVVCKMSKLVRGECL
jgi:hypothetical protein